MRETEIHNNYHKLLQEINLLATELGRNPSEIRVVCVSKNYPLQDILLANKSGATEFGENRVQELQNKQFDYLGLTKEEQANHTFHWHLIGNLQRNKVKDIVGAVKLIHSVDSIRLMEQINRVSKRYSINTEILFQVNVSREDTKNGFEISELDRAVEAVLGLDNIKLRGLMTMAPHYKNAAKTEPIFAKTKELLERYKPMVGQEFNQLSMGMSNDYRYAIAQGATLIRIGTKIFGTRKY